MTYPLPEAIAAWESLEFTTIAPPPITQTLPLAVRAPLPVGSSRRMPRFLLTVRTNDCVASGPTPLSADRERVNAADVASGRAGQRGGAVAVVREGDAARQGAALAQRGRWEAVAGGDREAAGLADGEVGAGGAGDGGCLVDGQREHWWRPVPRRCWP